MSPLSRRTFLGTTAVAATGAAMFPKQMFAQSAPLVPTGLTTTDRTALTGWMPDMVQFFWDLMDSGTGLIREKGDASVGSTIPQSSISVTGFGMVALCWGLENGWLPSGHTKAQVYARIALGLQTLGTAQANEYPTTTAVNGWLSHVLIIPSAGGSPTTPTAPLADTGDNALMQASMLFLRQYFHTHTGIVNAALYSSYAAQLLTNINWSWMMDTTQNAYHESYDMTAGDYSKNPAGHYVYWSGYSAVLLPILLGTGAQNGMALTNGLAAWQAVNRSERSVNGSNYVASPTAPLFAHQYPQIFFNLLNYYDPNFLDPDGSGLYLNYFKNSMMATADAQAWNAGQSSTYPYMAGSISSPSSTDFLWGLTASDAQDSTNTSQGHEYVVWGGPGTKAGMTPTGYIAPENNAKTGKIAYDGTIVPCAAGGSLIFYPHACAQTLQNIAALSSGGVNYAMGSYAFIDAVRPASGLQTQWVSSMNFGTNVGVTALMAANALSGYVQSVIMATTEATAAVSGVGLLACS